MDDALRNAYDPDTDILTVEGIRYHGDLFRRLGGLAPVGALLRLVERADGVLTVRDEVGAVGTVVGGRANSFGGFQVEVAHDQGWTAGMRVRMILEG